MSQLLHHKIYRSNHSSEWIIFLHGAGGSIATWKRQLVAVKDEFNLLLIDLRDHGQSKNIQPAHKKYTFDIITTDIHNVLTLHNIEKAHFITLSFGSVVLQSLSKSYPSLIDKMVIIGGIFKGNVAIKSFVQLARFFNLFLPYATMYKLFSFLLMPRKRNQRARRMYQIQAQKLTQEEYVKWVNIYNEFFKLLKEFTNQRIDNSTLVIMGGDDFVFLKSARNFVSNQKNASLIVIPKAGHICNVEQPESVNSLINDFLNDHIVQ